jgi:hypothetical protein
LPGFGTSLTSAEDKDRRSPEFCPQIPLCGARSSDAARLLIIEQILAPPNEGLAGKFADLNMLVVRADASEPAMSFPTCVLLRGLSWSALSLPGLDWAWSKQSRFSSRPRKDISFSQIPLADVFIPTAMVDSMNPAGAVGMVAAARPLPA